jgi:hypothetical protein
MNQKELVNSIRQLKEIKPRAEWAVLLKSKILISNFEIRNSKFFFGFLTQKRLAYAFATLLFVVVGLAGFAQCTVPGDMLFPIRKIAEQSGAALTGQTSLKQNAAALSTRINDLAQVTKEGRKNNIPSTISEIDASALELAKNLKDNPVQDSQTLKEIAVSLKTLADIPGTDLTANPDVKNLYQTVVQSQIEDLEKSTLTDEQKETLNEAKELYEQERYVDALEKILTI